MNMTTRRTFLRIVPLSSALVAQAVLAQTPAVDEKEPQAVALGYVTDAKRADKARFPKYAPPQHCAICQLYQGAATAPTAPCAIFAGRLVAGPGWCSAFVPRA
jgi:High potential iron-sulfur protein